MLGIKGEWIQEKEGKVWEMEAGLYHSVPQKSFIAPGQLLPPSDS